MPSSHYSEDSVQEDRQARLPGLHCSEGYPVPEQHLACDDLRTFGHVMEALKSECFPHPRVYPAKFAAKCLEIQEVMANDGRDQLSKEPWINSGCMDTELQNLPGCLVLARKVDEHSDLRDMYSALPWNDTWDDARIRTLLYYLRGARSLKISASWRPLIADLSVTD